MPKLEITPSGLIVNLSFMERLASVSGTIHVPWRHVRGATEDDGMHGDIGMRRVGCSIPGVLHAGTFRRKGDSQFIFAKPRQHLVVVELEDEKWARLVLGVADARAAANAINAALARSPKNP